VSDDYELKRVLSKLKALQPPSLEELFTSKEYFGITTASPVQRALCRVIDGLPLDGLRVHPDVVEAFGSSDTVPAGKPDEFDLLAGIRSGKTLLAAANCVHMSQTCDVSRLGPGEVPRVSLVSLKTDLANVAFNHVVGNVMASPKLARLVVGKPGTDSIVLRHPTGRPVEIKVVAGSRAGASLVARWSAGCVFDEYTRMVGSEDGVVNYDDARAAVKARILPGGQIISTGSPWAPFGPAYERFAEHWGHPRPDIVVVKAPGWLLNPVFWTPERCKHLKETDPEVYQTDCAANFTTPEESMFSPAEVGKSVRAIAGDVPYVPGCTYVAAMDPATRGNSWTLVIATRVGERRTVVAVRQRTGTPDAPLNPDEVLGEFGALLARYHCRAAYTDQAMVDALRPLARRHGLSLIQRSMTNKQRTDAYKNAKILFGTESIELPPDPVLRNDILRVKKRATEAGATIVLPKTSDGRHCDYAPSLVLVLSHWMVDYKAPPILGENHQAEAEAKAMRQSVVAKWKKLRK
jgi:hypothetical protein